MAKEGRKVRSERMRRTKRRIERKATKGRDKERRSPTPGRNTTPSSA